MIFNSLVSANDATLLCIVILYNKNVVKSIAVQTKA